MSTYAKMTATVNRDICKSLRGVADWLESHPEATQEVIRVIIDHQIEVQEIRENLPRWCLENREVTLIAALAVWRIKTHQLGKKKGA